jgi:DNA-binding XRE family transcriptional regulator
LKIFATSATSKSAVTVEVKDYNKTPIQSMLVKRPKWQDKEYRDAYMEASIEQGIAWQIRTNRCLRGITQTDLAKAIGTKQSAISRLEDPTYGAHSLETLVEIAKSFDCALSVKFISFSHLAYESEKLGESDLYAATFTEEMKEVYDQQAKKQIEHAPVTDLRTSEHIC